MKAPALRPAPLLYVLLACAAIDALCAAAAWLVLHR